MNYYLFSKIGSISHFFTIYSVLFLCLCIFIALSHVVGPVSSICCAIRRPIFLTVFITTCLCGCDDDDDGVGVGVSCGWSGGNWINWSLCAGGSAGGLGYWHPYIVLVLLLTND